MKAYIALPESSAFEVDKQQKLGHASVGLPRNIHDLSLKDTVERAVQTAIEGNRMKLQVATKDTVWTCLEVNMPEHDAFKMVQGGLLVRYLSPGGWRFYGDLDFGCLAHECSWCITLPWVSRPGLRRP